MKERDLVKKGLAALKREFGGFWVKLHGGLFQTVGLPDTVGCVRGRFIGIEWKAPGRLHKLTDRQQYVLDAIEGAGGLAFVTDDVTDAVQRVRRWLRKPLP